MAVTAKKENTIKKWRCSHCGRTANSSVKPGATYGGNCREAKNGQHTWKKES